MKVNRMLTHTAGRISFLLLIMMVLLPLQGLAAEGIETDGISIFSARLGVDYFAWETPFLLTGGDFRFPIRSGLYGSLGADFGIHTEKSGTETTASFLLPLRAGLLFPFPGEKLSFTFSTGLSPVFLLDEENSSFYLGPYAGARFTLAVHPVLSIFAEMQQTLLFGGDEWINSGTRLTGGISF
jgi:hypothetical protein